MAIVRHVALKGIGVKALRKKAGWGSATLRLILKHSF